MFAMLSESLKTRRSTAMNSKKIAQMFESPNLEILILCCSTWLLPGKTSISTGVSSHHVNHLRYFLTCFCRKDLFHHSMERTTPPQSIDNMPISLTRSWSFLVALVSGFGSSAISNSGSSSFARSTALLTEDAASGMNVMHVVPSLTMKLQPIELTLLALSNATHPIITLGLLNMGCSIDARGTWAVRRPKAKEATRGNIAPGSQGLRKWGSKGSAASDVHCCCPGELKARSDTHQTLGDPPNLKCNKSNIVDFKIQKACLSNFNCDTHQHLTTIPKMMCMTHTHTLDKHTHTRHTHVRTLQNTPQRQLSRVKSISKYLQTNIEYTQTDIFFEMIHYLLPFGDFPISSSMSLGMIKVVFKNSLVVFYIQFFWIWVLQGWCMNYN